MKNRILAFAFAIVASLAISAFAPTGAQSQDAPKDTVSIVDTTSAEQVFTGKEKTTKDSLESVQTALSDPDLQKLIGSAIAVVAAHPNSDSTPAQWSGWIASVILLVLLVIQYLGKKKLEQKLKGSAG